ncbi:MAG: hypothetical protein ACK4SZ_05525 [Allosphingosinicella sp.]|uniref:hypothetical protein n=1 Tax=Allosphingosinicella sp. TaxID=2823234 RepID=UPI0039631E9B
MSQQRDFYIARAAEARRDAAAATLANVRERCLRAADAWDAMADRAERSERHREADAARKAAMAANEPQSVVAH